MTKLEDVKGLKIRVLQNPLYVDLWNALGANAVPMPFPEVYSALEQKTVDGQENPAATLVSSKLGEVQKHYSLTRAHLLPRHRSVQQAGLGEAQRR